jgi:cytosine/adenosine deaminase-related metal-dependent hydrolase
MSYLKFSSDHLFTGHNWLDNSYVLITTREGEVVDIVPVSEAGEDIAFFPGILSPGFVNCHCHLELSHMKGIIPERTGMVDFLVKVIRERSFEPASIKQAIAEAEMAMLGNGIVAVGDICNTTVTIEQKKLGHLQYHNFIETIGFSEATASQRFETAHAIYEQFARLYRAPGESNSIVPHAPYSVSPKLFQLIARFPGNRLLSIHNQESEAENEFLQKGTGDFHRLYETLGMDISFYQAAGKRSLQSCLPHFLSNQSIILVHNVMTNSADLRFIQDTQTASVVFCLCPNANLYIGNPLPDIELLRKFQAHITIGTDSLASNHQLSVLAELKTIHQHLPSIPVFELLQWATINGARALQLDTALGSFEAGKQPGVLLIENELKAVKRLL